MASKDFRDKELSNTRNSCNAVSLYHPEGESITKESVVVVVCFCLFFFVVVVVVICLFYFLFVCLFLLLYFYYYYYKKKFIGGGGGGGGGVGSPSLLYRLQRVRKHEIFLSVATAKLATIVSSL